jgi:hypothetical protein
MRITDLVASLTYIGSSDEQDLVMIQKQLPNPPGSSVSNMINFKKKFYTEKIRTQQ